MTIIWLLFTKGIQSKIKFINIQTNESEVRSNIAWPFKQKKLKLIHFQIAVNIHTLWQLVSSFDMWPPDVLSSEHLTRKSGTSAVHFLCTENKCM